MKPKKFETTEHVHAWIIDNADEVRAALMAFEAATGQMAGTMCLLAVRDHMRALMTEAMILKNKRQQVAKAR